MRNCTTYTLYLTCPCMQFCDVITSRANNRQRGGCLLYCKQRVVKQQSRTHYSPRDVCTYVCVCVSKPHQITTDNWYRPIVQLNVNTLTHTHIHTMIDMLVCANHYDQLCDNWYVTYVRLLCTILHSSCSVKYPINWHGSKENSRHSRKCCIVCFFFSWYVHILIRR